MPLGYQPDNVGSSDSHPQYIPGGNSYSVGDIFTNTDGGVTSAYIVQTDFVSTDFVSDSSNFVGIAGGDSTYTGTATINVGGIGSGTSFVDKDLQFMMQSLLEPYQPPAFSSFSMGGFSTLEVGDEIPSGAKTFNWGTTQSSNVEPNTIEIIDVTGGSISLGSGLANDGSESLSLGSPIQKVTNTSHTFRIEGENTQAGIFTRNYNVNWQYKRFYGKEGSSGPLTEAQIEGLPTQGLASGFAGTYSIPAGAGYVYFAFPTAWGTASGFKDTSTNLDVAMEASYTVAVTNSFGVTHNYRVHRSTNVLNGAITIQVS